jgi:two-component system cell cycle sensor histidine kinase/response regulator CckA
MPTKLTDLIDLDRLQKIQDAFSHATGVASVITDVDGVPLTKSSNFCRLCMNIIRESEKGYNNCMYSDSVIGGLGINGPVVQPCLSGGLYDGGAGIFVGDEHIGNWLIGQIRQEDMSTEKLLTYADVIGVDREEYKIALEEVTVMSLEKFKAIASMLYIFANQLSQLAYQNRLLQRSQTYIKTAFSSMGDGVISTNQSGEILQFNPTAENLTGWSEQEAKGKLLEEIFHVRNMATGERVKISTGKESKDQILLLTKEGKRKQIEYIATPIKEGGISLGIIIIIRDVAERIRLEEQSTQKQKMDAVGQMTGGLVHDFNNMLTGIMGAADIILNQKNLDSEVKDMAETILNASVNAASLTKKLLDFSRKSTGGSSTFDLHQAVNEAIDILERSIDKKIIITRELQAMNTIMYGDNSQIVNAVINLGLNARDAMPKGGILKISSCNRYIGTRENDKVLRDWHNGFCIELIVEDTGSGMTAEQMEKIFEPFYTTKSSGKGTGLGLSSVYEAVQNHEGIIRVDSQYGEGSQFRLYFHIRNTPETSN